jgi:arsenate reductase
MKEGPEADTRDGTAVEAGNHRTDTRNADSSRIGQERMNIRSGSKDSGTTRTGPGTIGDVEKGKRGILTGKACDPIRESRAPIWGQQEIRGLKKQSVLFICSRNAGRSPLAEGLLRGIYGDRYEVYSAGFHPSTLNPLVRSVLEEQGLDSRSLHSKALQDIPPGPFDKVVLLNGRAEDGVPLPPAREYLRCSFPDPVSGSDGNGRDLEAFRSLRDRMKEWILEEF